MQTRERDFMGYTKIDDPSERNAFDFLGCTSNIDCEPPPELAWVRYQVRTSTGKGDKPQDIQRSAESFSKWALRQQEVRPRRLLPCRLRYTIGEPPACMCACVLEHRTPCRDRRGVAASGGDVAGGGADGCMRLLRIALC